jgi:NAD(P)H-hydrate epimerase
VNVPHGFPTITADSLPWLSVEQMRQADDLAMGPYGIDLLQMMELAGSALAELVDRLAPAGGVAVLAGPGNNGGGGLCAARHLVDRGRPVSVTLSAPEQLAEAPRHHVATLERMGITSREEPPDFPVVVDALVGYGLCGPLRGKTAALSRWSTERWIASLDFPSGHGFDGAVVPDVTLTLALPKKDLADVRPLYVADLGLPSVLWRELGLDVDRVFETSRILEIVD